MKPFHRSIFAYPTFDKACKVARKVSKESGRYFHVFEDYDGYRFDSRYDPNSEGVSQ